MSVACAEAPDTLEKREGEMGDTDAHESAPKRMYRRLTQGLNLSVLRAAGPVVFYYRSHLIYASGSGFHQHDPLS